jgi:hypothetical protein
MRAARTRQRDSAAAPVTVVYPLGPYAISQNDRGAEAGGLLRIGSRTTFEIAISPSQRLFLEMLIRVFISHSSIDTWVARQIGSHIEARGAAAFLDERDIPAGGDFLAKILNAEPDCEELLVLLTPWSIKRAYVLFEISCFTHSWKRIVGIPHGLTADEVAKDPYIGVLLGRRDLVDINRIESYFEELDARVKATAGVRADA